MLMTNHVQTPENNERLKRYFTALERMSGAMEKLFSLKKPSIAGESFYTDRDLSEKLKISRRTLQDYRNNGILPYRQLGGKILYRESNIERVVQSCYRGKF